MAILWLWHMLLSMYLINEILRYDIRFGWIVKTRSKPNKRNSNRVVVISCLMIHQNTSAILFFSLEFIRYSRHNKCPVCIECAKEFLKLFSTIFPHFNGMTTKNGICMRLAASVDSRKEWHYICNLFQRKSQRFKDFTFNAIHIYTRKICHYCVMASHKILRSYIRKPE